MTLSTVSLVQVMLQAAHRVLLITYIIDSFLHITDGSHARTSLLLATMVLSMVAEASLIWCGRVSGGHALPLRPALQRSK
jgi:hypothetical protein